jgi:NAD(P) transhydrogenase subunit alpha
MVTRMAPGSAIVDLAAGRGGNCELTEPDRTVNKRDVTIMGPTDLAASVPYHASQMYSNNISTYLLHIAKNGQIEVGSNDEILRETLLSHGGRVVNPRVLGLPGKPRGET